jgi:arginase
MFTELLHQGQRDDNIVYKSRNLSEGEQVAMRNEFILTPFFLDDPLPGLERLPEPDWIINKPDITAIEKQQRLVKLYQPLREMVANTIRRGHRPVSIAGDCCTSLAVLAGLQLTGLSPTLIWFDAHGDFNTWETTPSGFLGGMPLAMLVGRGDQTIVTGVGLKAFPESQVILTDARDLDPGERRTLARSEVQHIIDASDLLEIPLPNGSLYVHFDTDLINPKEAPAVNYLAEGGPSVAVLKRLFRRIAQTGRLKAVSVSSWNPVLDKDGSTEETVLSLIDDLLVA